MTRPRRTRVRALALALLLLAASLAAGAVAGEAAAPGAAPHASGPTTHASVAGSAAGPATVGPGVDENRSESAPITRCFTGTGYPISIGDGAGGATMETVVHLSVLTDPGAGNEFGVESVGRLDGESVVTLAAGVRLTARQAIADGIDPFAAFDVLYAYELRLPMFAGAIGDADYEDDGSPIESSAGAVDC